VTFAVVILAAAALVLLAGRIAPWIPPTRSFVAAGPRSVRYTPRERWRQRPGVDDDDVAEWCVQVARGVRAGSSLAHAVVQAGAAAPAGAAPFRPVVHALTRGRGLADAVSETAGDDDPASATGLVVPVLMACAELGGPAAMPLERVAATLRARSAERAERRTNSAQARLSAKVLSTVPLGVLALLALAEPAVRSTLASPVGAACVVGGGLFNLAGWCWMRHLVGGAE
jgi:Flp pilus assembly protein TadB